MFRENIFVKLIDDNGVSKWGIKKANESGTTVVSSRIRQGLYHHSICFNNLIL
jgi:hypothetical protein